MKTKIKQIIVTVIIVATAYALMCGLINILTRTIDNPTTHIALSLFVVAWITSLALYTLARTLITLREPHTSARPVIYTDHELAARSRAAKYGPLGEITDTQDHHQEKLKRKYAIK